MTDRLRTQDVRAVFDAVRYARDVLAGGEMSDPPLVKELEAIVGKVKIVQCPWYCDSGYRGCDACNRCGKTGSGFRLNGQFYPNTEAGWRKALEGLV